MTLSPPAPVKYKSDELRCSCGKCLGAWSDGRLIIRKAGLILQGGFHSWTCGNCGVTQEIDLR